MSYHAVRHVRSFIKRSMGLAGRGNSGKDVEEHTMRVARALRSSMTDVEQTAALVGTLLAWLTGPLVEAVFTDAALDVARYREQPPAPPTPIEPPPLPAPSTPPPASLAPPEITPTKTFNK